MSSSVTSACSSASSSAVAPLEPVSTDEIADEVKVFRTNDVEDSMDIASSSAELNADKKDLAFEAEIESGQAEPIAVAQRMLNPLQSACMNFPSPSYDFLFPLFMPPPLSPIQAYAATAAAAAYNAVQRNPLLKMCSAASVSPNVAAAISANAQLAAAAAIVRHSPNYMQLGGGWNLAPPAFGIGSPVAGNFLQQMSQAQNAQGFNQHLPNAPNLQQLHQSHLGGLLNSPMTSMSNGLNGINLSEQRRQQTQQRAASSQPPINPHNLQTPKASKSKSTPSSAHKHMKSMGEQGAKDKEGHIKKPCNAFMWFMKVNRARLLEQEGCEQKQSALLNQQLGKMWQQMSKKDQQKYYDMAAAEREEHQQKYPNWTARENYAIHKKNKKKKREKSIENNEQKKCRARFGVENQAQWCKHCRRKKRCLNVRDADSPMNSSTTAGSGLCGSGMPTNHLSMSHHAGFEPSSFMPTALSLSSLGITAATQSPSVSSPYSSAVSSGGKRSESNFSSDSAATNFNNCTPPPNPMRVKSEEETERTPKPTVSTMPDSALLQRPMAYGQQIPESFQQMLNMPFGADMGYAGAGNSNLAGCANPTSQQSNVIPPSGALKQH